MSVSKSALKIGYFLKIGSILSLSSTRVIYSFWGIGNKFVVSQTKFSKDMDKTIFLTLDLLSQQFLISM